MTYITAELRRAVVKRADNCCEYCLLSQEDIFFRFEVDHIISEKQSGPTEENNLCLSCPDCNSAKGSDIGSIDRQTGKFTGLFNPRQHVWSQHFRLNNVVIEPLTAEGRVTVFLLQFNHPDRVSVRELALEYGRYPCLP